MAQNTIIKKDALLHIEVNGEPTADKAKWLADGQRMVRENLTKIVKRVLFLAIYHVEKQLL